MDGESLKRRALAFAFGAGALVFSLTIIGFMAWPGAAAGDEVGRIGGALSLAIMCAVLSWAAAERAIAVHAGAIDAISVRLGDAAAGDIISDAPAAVAIAWPRVAGAMDIMFARMRRNLERIHRLALYDVVTGLPNRIHFRDAATALLEAAPPRRAALLFVDLDRFKSVNDRLGHAVGDQVLAEVAERMLAAAAAAHPNALVARLAGDEFTIMLPAGGAKRATALGEAVVESIAQPIVIDGHRLSIGASVGVAVLASGETDLAVLMRAADIAMYHAKAQGRGCVRLFSPELADGCAGRAPMGATSAADPEGTLEFTPIHELAGGGVASLQAQWRDAAGAVSPYLPDAILDEAIAGNAIDVVVALHPRQLGDRALAARLCAALPNSGVTLLLDGAALAQDQSGVVIALRAAGASIALGGFGATMPGLDMLRQLAPAALHIAPELTAALGPSPQAGATLAALVALGHTLGAAVVAEGGDPALLRAAGCDRLVGEPLGYAAPSARLMIAA